MKLRLPSFLRRGRASGEEKGINNTGYGYADMIPRNWDWQWWQKGHNIPGGRKTSTVSACIDAYAQTTALLPIRHYRVSDNGTKERITTSAASRTVLRPNAYQTRSDFFLNIIESLLFQGNAYIVAKRNDRNEIAEMHQLESRGTQPYVTEDKKVFYAAGDTALFEDYEQLKYMIPARDMCHIRLHCPRHPLVGVTPLMNAAESVAANAAITGQQARFFSNMSRPSGVLSTDMKLTADQMSQLRAAWESQAKDMNTGGIPILGSGISWQSMGITSQDAQLVEAFHMTVEDIARAFRVPMPLVNDNRHSTYNNVEQLIAVWLSGGLGFMIDHVENALDRFFNLPTSEVLEFDTDRLLRTDFSGRVDGYARSIQSGLMSPNEARSRFSGLPPVAHGEKPIVQQQMVPLGWTEEQAKKEPAPAPVPAANDSELTDDEKHGLAVHYLKKALCDG